jgi:16S rRNA (guanine527-N7)-methyltransferase
VKHEKLIAQYIELLKEFNKVTNIYSENAYDKLDFHIQDSINIAHIIGNSKTKVIDLGSGSGFPAVIIAIINPQNSLKAIESKTKKCEFLRLVKEKLSLTNLEVLNFNAFEILNKHKADWYTAKAFKKYPEVIKIFDKFAPYCSQLLIPISLDQKNVIEQEKDINNLSVKELNGYYYLLKGK